MNNKFNGKALMQDSVLAQLNIYSSWVKTGKPCAMILLQNRYVQEAKKYVENQSLKFYAYEYYPEWSQIYIYKHDYMLAIIKNLPEQPKTKYDHWILGKAFGYSDESIKEYLDSIW